MCERDPLFFINLYGWTYDPRRVECPDRPFITYGFQDDAIRKMATCVGYNDVLVAKSRDLGASWICLLVLNWFWHFKPGVSFLLVSRTEDLVDKSDDPDSLFWKLEFFNEHLPAFLKPATHRITLHLRNLHNGAVFDGASTTGNVGRGGRRTAVLMDEFAAFEPPDGYRALSATQSNTRCRIFNSTPQGDSNAFADVNRLAQDPESPVERCVIHWSQHPIYRQGLYRVTGRGEHKVLDQGYDYPLEFKFNHEETAFDNLRSPWYDMECLRSTSKASVAQELDIDFLGSGRPYFDSSMLRRIKANCRAPYIVGELEYDELSGTPGHFSTQSAGRLHLWMHVGANDKPVGSGPYVVGADISTGTGASESVLTIGDKSINEVVGRYRCRDLNEHEFATLTVALARWLGGAFLIWEANGPGMPYGNRIIALGYDNFFLRENEASMRKKKQQMAGWYSTRETKRLLLSEWGRAIASEEFIEREEFALLQAGEYKFQPDGSIKHQRSLTCADPSGQNDNHGDIVISAAVCYRGMKEVIRKKDVPQVVPIGSMAHRMLERNRARRLSNSWGKKMTSRF